MLTVAICDDEAVFCQQIRDYVERLAGELQIPVQIRCYADADALLAQAQEPDVLFLDIQIGKDNGIAVAREIRERNRNLVLIFMTNFIQYAVEGYTVQAFRYLLKPIDYTQFRDEVRVVFQELHKAEALAVHTAQGEHYVRPNEIRYIETEYGKRLKIHTDGAVLETSGTLSPWEKQLGADFFRVHSSFLLNMMDVRRLGRDTVLLSGGEEIPISKHRRKSFQDALTAYVKGEKFR